MDLSELFEKAWAYSLIRHPQASVQKRHAFANSVVYLVSGYSSGSKGPSIREHLVSYSLAGERGMVVPNKRKGLTLVHPDGSLPMAGDWTFENACTHCEAIVYGPLPLAKAREVAAYEYCFDDDPEDLEVLAKS